MDKITVDITPHPRVLSVLGEIEFKVWQCIAELVDNSIDGFLDRIRAGSPIADPTVHVAFGRDTVVVKDNGPGMSLQTLETAVKAGWTSHERFGSLGLYGIGFNIATARLGSTVTIWTTRASDPVWYGLEIDLRKLARQTNFVLEGTTRTKSNPKISGTEIEVSNIKLDWRDYFTNAPWIRANVTDRLASIYGTMLRNDNPYPLKFSLIVNNKKVQAWEHCVWPADKTVYRKNDGLIRPIQEIDVTFGTRYISKSTGELYDSKEGVDESDIIEIPERVYGWLGIQRYADEKEFGVDIIRNGRKIEVGCKDVFDWEGVDGQLAKEYPIDDIRGRGRIVGEVHLDHGYVHYTKHRFEREHSSWKQLLLAIRNNEPLTNRGVYGLGGVNPSPLGVLFRAFRRNSPQSNSDQTFESILFIRDNEQAKTWAREYRKGNSKYRDDQIWFDALGASTPKSSSGGKKTGSSTAAQEDAGDPDDDFLLAGGENEGGDTQDTDTDDTSRSNDTGSSTATHPGSDTTASPPQITIQRTIIPELSLHLTGVGLSGRTYDVEVYSVENPNTSQARSAWMGRLTERNVYEIEVNLRHPAFNSTSLQIRDAVLAQVAYLITSEETATLGSQEGIGYGDILVALRERYASLDSLDANQLRLEINDIRKQLAERVSRALTETQRNEFLGILAPEESARITLAQLRGPSTLSVLDYLEMHHLALLFQSHSQTFFEAGCFNIDWTPGVISGNFILLEEHRNKLQKDILVPLTEIGDFAKQFASTPDLSRPYRALIRACVNRLREFLISR